MKGTEAVRDAGVGCLQVIWIARSEWLVLARAVGKGE